MSSLAHGSRGTELRGLALLDIAPFTTQGHYVAWYDDMFQRVEGRIQRYKGKRMGYRGKRMGYKGARTVQRETHGVVDRAELTCSPNMVISNAEALDQLSSGAKQQKGR